MAWGDVALMFVCHPFECVFEVPPINDRSDRSRRWGALRSEIKEEAEGRGTFAEQGTPSA